MCSNWYGKTCVYLSRVPGKPTGEVYSTLDYYDPYTAETISIHFNKSRIETKAEKLKNLEDEYQKLESKHKRHRMKIKEIVDDYNSLRVFDSNYMMSDNEEKNFEFLKEECKKIMKEKEKINIKMSDFGILPDAEYQLYRKMKTKRMIRTVSKNVVEITINKEKFQVNRYYVPELLKEVNKSMVFDMKVSFVHYGHNIEFDAKVVRDKIKPLADKRYSKSERVS